MAIKIGFQKKDWDKARPKDKDKKFGASFGSALGDVEKALAAEKKGKNDASAIESCKQAMEAVAAAAQDLMSKECDSKKDKDLVNALKKFQSDCQSEIKRLSGSLSQAQDAAAADEEEAASLDELLCVDTYANMFKKAKNADSAERGPGFVFSFHQSDGEACKLSLMLPAKVQSTYARIKRQLPKFDKAYKKKNIVSGRAYRDGKMLVLECTAGEGMPEVPGLDKKIKLWALKNKKDISPMKRLSFRIPGMDPIDTDMPEDEGEPAEQESAEQESEEQVAGEAASQAPEAQASAAAATAAPSQAAEAATPGATQSATSEAAAADGQATQDAALEDRRRQFRKARQAWQATKEKAIQDLEAVKDGIRDYYLDDPEQFKIATSKLSQLDAIMDNLGDELRDILDKYVSTPKSRHDQLHQLATEASETVERFLEYARNDRLLNAVDQKEFADVTVKAPLEKALRVLVKALS